MTTKRDYVFGQLAEYLQKPAIRGAIVDLMFTAGCECAHRGCDAIIHMTDTCPVADPGQCVECGARGIDIGQLHDIKCNYWDSRGCPTPNKCFIGSSHVCNWGGLVTSRLGGNLLYYRRAIRNEDRPMFHTLVCFNGETFLDDFPWAQYYTLLLADSCKRAVCKKYDTVIRQLASLRDRLMLQYHQD